MIKAHTLHTEITTDPAELSKCLEKVLYVPREVFKDRIIGIIVDYIAEKRKDPRFVVKPVVAYRDDIPVGFVNCMVHPDYKTYGRKALTFGWLLYDSYEVCKILMTSVEKIGRRYRFRRIRGPINFPKGLGGIGFQTSGFEQPLLYGVAFNSPKINYISDLEEFGYTYETEYACLHVDAKDWDKGKEIDENIEFRYYSFEQIPSILTEAKKLGKYSFQTLLPDTTSGEKRWRELFVLHRHIQHSNPLLPDNFSEITNNKTFLESWKGTNLTDIDSLFPIAFDKSSGEIVGFLLGIPNIYEEWGANSNEAIHTVNVDTALVHPDYKGKGIFSGLNNIGQLTCGFYGIDTFEGTYVWTNSVKGINNEEAINSIFPHCSTVRKHIIVEKKIRSSAKY